MDSHPGPQRIPVPGKGANFFQSVSYALPIVITNFLFYPMVSILPGIYARDFGLSLGVIASVMFFSRLFDAVIDPWVGYWSDRYHARTGSRKPWVVIGCLGLVVSSYFLSAPPEPVQTGYFLAWFVAFYMFWTLIEVPHIAWGSDISASAAQRTRLFSVRSFAMFFGVLLYALLPMIPALGGEGFTPQTLKWSVLFAGALAVPLLLICVNMTPTGRTSLNTNSLGFVDLLPILWGNKQLLLVLAGGFISWSGYGMWFALGFIFADSYLNIGKTLPLIYAMTTLVSLATVAVLYSQAEKFEKNKVLFFSMLCVALSALGFSALSPGGNHLVLFTVLMAVSYMGNALFQSVAYALMSDISDYGSWKFGADYSAVYVALFLFLAKLGLTLGGAFALAILHGFGFDPALAGENSASSVFGLKLSFSYIPALLLFAGSIFFINITINRRRHHVIRQRLDQRRERQITGGVY